jgi:CheY-like chemotaxis protein
MPKPKILVVDDEPVILEYMRLALENYGYQVVVVSNGKEALEKAITEKPDIILLDITLPDMDGTEVCIKLKEIPQTEDITVFLVTATLPAELAGDISRFGAKDFIVKPFNFEVLQTKLKQALDEKKQQ